MTTSKLDFYIGVLVLALAVVAHGYISNKKADQATLDQIKQQFQTTHASDQQVIKEARASEVQNQKDTSAKIIVLHEQQAQPIAPVDYAKINQMIQDHIGATAHTDTNPQTQQAETTVPTLQLRNSELECDADKVLLEGCKATTSNLNTQLVATQKENSGLQEVNVAQEKVIKGGTFGHRLKVGFKHSMCGAAGFGAGMLGARTNTQTGAAVGAGAWAACEALVSLR